MKFSLLPLFAAVGVLAACDPPAAPADDSATPATTEPSAVKVTPEPAPTPPPAPVAKPAPEPAATPAPAPAAPATPKPAPLPAEVPDAPAPEIAPVEPVEVKPATAPAPTSAATPKPGPRHSANASSGGGAVQVQGPGPNSKGFARGGDVKTARTRPTPLFKFYAMERVLGPVASGNPDFWPGFYNKVQCDIDPDDYKDTGVAIPVLLGFRICDGVMAIKARNAEKLNACSDDIEKLARKMGVKDSEMTRARKVRSYANKGEWNRVFLELGFLQRDIEANQTGGLDAKKILYAAGWLQGARYYSTIVHEHYGPDLAALLREPLFVRSLAEDLRTSKTATVESAIVQQILASLDKVAGLVDVPINTALSREQVEQMFGSTTTTVLGCVDSAR